MTATRGADLSLVEDELNSQEKTQGPHFSGNFSFHPLRMIYPPPRTSRTRFGPVDYCSSKHGAQISKTL